MAKKFNANQHNNEEKRTPRTNNRTPRERREPEYTEDQKILAGYFVKNINEYLIAHDMFQAGEVKDMNQANRNLMILPDRAPYVSSDMLGMQVDCDIHLLRRSINSDRENNGELTRATATFVAIDMNAIPGYAVDMYLNKNYTGMVTVTPITEKGPNYRNAYRVKIGRAQEAQD